MARVDTNYIIRYLIDDDKKMAEIAEELLTTKRVYISNEILAEVVYVLDGVYNIDKKIISELLIKLIRSENIFVSDIDILNEAFNLYKSQNLDFVDCLLCAYSKNEIIYTFDKKLLKCIKRDKQ